MTVVGRPWDLDLVDRQGPGTLVHVARQGRLLRSGSGGGRLELHWMDEAALALMDAAIQRRSSLLLLYPALAPEVAVLLAAQYLIQALVRGNALAAVGLVTGDPARAARLWDELMVVFSADRNPLVEVYPIWWASPDGEVPAVRPKGIVIGRRCTGWPVDIVVADDLAGPVDVTTTVPVVRIAADPFDTEVARTADLGGPIWGWSESTLRLYAQPERPPSSTPRVPFSVAAERVAGLVRGIAVDVQVCAHDEAERSIAAARDALIRLSRLVGPNPGRHESTGLRVSWSHLSTLTSLPCQPADYDLHAGIPPRAARPTGEFEREIAGWARTLAAEPREVAEEIAGAVGELRATLEKGNPTMAAIERYSLDPVPAYVIVRTRTAARAVCAAFKRQPDEYRIGSVRVVWTATLHSEPVRRRALVVGAPPRAAWHRIASGIAGRVDVVVVGSAEAARVQAAWSALQHMRAHWSGQHVRALAWRQLIGTEPPPAYPEEKIETSPVVIVEGTSYAPAVDPFTPLGTLLRDDRPLLAEEGIAERLVVRVGEHDFRATVPAVELLTDHGYVLIPSDREVDIIEGHQLGSNQAARLTKGMRIVLGRDGGRLDLLAALEERLAHRGDLLAGRALVDLYQMRVREGFKSYSSDGLLDVTDFVARLKSLGCKKTDTAIRGWVTRGGPMGPRDREDIRLINLALRMRFMPVQIDEIHSSLERIRTFRRQAGLAVSRAATAALLSREDSRIDPELGLSVAELRDAVLVATVLSVRTFPRLVNVTEVGHLQEVPFT